MTKRHIHFRVILKFFYVAPIGKNEAEPSKKILNIDGFPQELWADLVHHAQAHILGHVPIWLSHSNIIHVFYVRLNPQGLKLRGESSNSCTKQHGNISIKIFMLLFLSVSIFIHPHIGKQFRMDAMSKTNFMWQVILQPLICISFWAVHTSYFR